jgi:hypothetical protein
VVGAVLRERDVHVGEGEDLDESGVFGLPTVRTVEGLLALARIGVSFEIVMGDDELSDRFISRSDEFESDSWMFTDDQSFLFAERIALGEDMNGNEELSHIVEERAVSECGEMRIIDAEKVSECETEPGDRE